ncbi:MAG: GNAT family N-acetyltransferase [Novosphingobium sp.]
MAFLSGAASPLPPIARAASADRAALVATLSAAFADDPAMAWIMPDRADRVRRLPRLFGLLVSEDLADGWCLASPGREAVTLWRAGASIHTSPWQLLRGLPGFIAALGPNLLRALAASSAIEAHHPRGLTCDYLHFAGVDPAFQGRDWGGAAIRAGMAQARTKGVPIYLETATPENVGLYQRLGFAVTQEWDVPRGGPHFWSMLWRPE